MKGTRAGRGTTACTAVVSLSLSAWIYHATQAGETLVLVDESLSLEAPFPAGEKLYYDIYWHPPAVLDWIIGNLKAGEIQVEIRESDYQGRDTYTIVAKAATTGFVRGRYAVDDRFESVVDRSSFKSYLYKKQLREGTRTNKEITARFDYGASQVVVSEINHNDSAKVRRDRTYQGIPGPLSDVLSVFYAARLRNMSPGESYAIHLVDERQPETVHVAVEGEEKVKTPLDRFPALRVGTDSGFFRGAGGFKVWFATGGSRIPVRFQADAKIGKVFGELVGVDSGSRSRGIIRQKE